MLFERQRFQSFTHAWTYEQAKKFSKAGFFRVKDLTVQCVFCLNVIQYADCPIQVWWDDPMAHHNLLFPDCPFVCKKPDLGNVVPIYKSVMEVPDPESCWLAGYPVHNYLEY